MKWKPELRTIDQRGRFALIVALVLFVVIVTFVIPLSNGRPFLDCLEVAAGLSVIIFLLFKSAQWLTLWINAGDP